MKFAAVIFACLLSVVPATAFETFNPLMRHKQHFIHKATSGQPRVTRRRRDTSKYINANTERFVVNGTGIPDVDFDVGESYAGTLPVGGLGDSSDGRMFFWFFPTSAEDDPREIIIWLNGGPGCSSLSGLLQENGPFLHQRGTFKPHANPWSWHHLSNVVWVEQPIGTGFSTGTVTAQNEDDIAQQFMGFWRNFVDAFGLQGYEVFVTGESYAGAFCPYIASNMLDTNDTDYFDVQGMLMYDPLISGGSAADASTKHFVHHWRNVLPYNDSVVAQIENMSNECGFDEYTTKYLTFPPLGPQPDVCQGPGINAHCTGYLPSCDIYKLAVSSIFDINPGFNVYQVAQVLPVPDDDVLGFPYTLQFLPPGKKLYFDRKDVKKAINAPKDVDWRLCAEEAVFDGGDNSDPSSYRAIPEVIERTKNVHIAHGTMDMVLLANGTLLAIQNMTWGGRLGFQRQPREPLFVPHHPNPSVEGSSGQGVLGTWHSERGFTWALIDLAGHQNPAWQAAASFRQVQVLLGRVSNLSDTTAFPMYESSIQPNASMLGSGTALYSFREGT